MAPRLMKRCVWTVKSGLRSRFRTKPVVLLGRIGRRTQYQLEVGLRSIRESTRTSFWVPSVVPVGRVVITLEARPGFARTTVLLIRTAQCAVLPSVSLIECG